MIFFKQDIYPQKLIYRLNFEVSWKMLVLYCRNNDSASTHVLVLFQYYLKHPPQPFANGRTYYKQEHMAEEDA